MSKASSEILSATPVLHHVEHSNSLSSMDNSDFEALSEPPLRFDRWTLKTQGCHLKDNTSGTGSHDCSISFSYVTER
ncbi:hypothetical protein PM082_001071 [Marasmius tenuissimus]|nr:hypothetical protein PM082_001071 [Marasmius tenuissimus]